jgi:hypothetical protein
VAAPTFLEQVEHPHHCVWLRVLLQLTVFGLAIIGPSIWFQSHRRPPENRFFLNARHEIKNYRFIPVSLGSLVEKSLSTTELFNGHFIDARSQRVSVFFGNWQPGQGDISSVTHTPEKCWVGNGFQILPYGGPPQLFISIGGRKISFQCRVLKRFDLATPEITLWAACIDGIWEGIPYYPPLEQIEDAYTVLNRFQHMLVSYKGQWKFFCDRIILKSNPADRKQFIRFSTPLTTKWQPALGELEAFANRWLEEN